MSLPVSGGGFQVGLGNINEVILGVQGVPGVYSTAATILTADLLTGILNCNTTSNQTYTLPTVTLLEQAVVNAKLNSSFDFFLISTGGTGTLAVGTGWTIVGLATVATTISAHFRARKTGDGAWTAYRIS